MYLNKEIPKDVLAKIKLVVFDSDGVSIPRGTEIQERITPEAIDMHIQTFMITDTLSDLIKRLTSRFTVAVSSGRSLLYLQSMYGKIIGENTILQAENGNLSLIGGTVVQHFSYDKDYFSLIAKIRRDVRELPIKGVEPKQFILSVHADKEIMEVYDIVKKHDTKKQLRVMWNGEAFDIQKREISKAAGLQKLIAHLGISSDEVVAMGDRVNDRELLAAAGVGVSADKEAVPAEYWTVGDKLPGESLARYLVAQCDL